MGREVPFLAYFSYCVHYCVLPDKIPVKQLLHSAAENNPADAQSQEEARG